MSDVTEPRGGFLRSLGDGRNGIAAGLVGALIGAGAMLLAQSQGLLDANRARTERIVHEYLLANPHVLREASERLHDSDVAEVIDANRAAFETPYAGAWAGAEKGDVVLVEFFDYACPYCHKAFADVERLLKEDPKLKVVWREWPVLGDDSIVAAETSLAAARSGRFHDFYRTLYASGRPTPAAIAAAGRVAGVAPVTGESGGREEIGKNDQLARAIGASGTPVFVIGDRVLQGAVGYDALKQAIADARTANAS